jgi:hypothetical protein
MGNPPQSTHSLYGIPDSPRYRKTDHDFAKALEPSCRDQQGAATLNTPVEDAATLVLPQPDRCRLRICPERAIPIPFSEDVIADKIGKSPVGL